MRKNVLSAMTFAILLSLASFDNASALSVAQIPLAIGIPEITLVMGGCGPGWHPDWAGRCWPNRVPVVVAPAPPSMVVLGHDVPWVKA
jgi:hypothetical protein